MINWFWQKNYVLIRFICPKTSWFNFPRKNRQYLPHTHNLLICRGHSIIIAFCRLVSAWWRSSPPGVVQPSLSGPTSWISSRRLEVIISICNNKFTIIPPINDLNIFDRGAVSVPCLQWRHLCPILLQKHFSPCLDIHSTRCSWNNNAWVWGVLIGNYLLLKMKKLFWITNVGSHIP